MAPSRRRRTSIRRAPFGEHLLGDGDIFEASAKEQLYTLAPLQRQGAAFKFHFDPEGDITHVALREVRVDEAQITKTGRLRRSPWFLTLGDSQNALRRLKDVASDLDIADLRIVHAKIDVAIEVDDSEIVVPVTWHGNDRVAEEDADLRHDIARALGTLPPEARGLCAALGTYTLRDLVGRDGVSRSALYRRVARLRLDLAMRGLAPRWDDFRTA